MASTVVASYPPIGLSEPEADEHVLAPPEPAPPATVPPIAGSKPEPLAARHGGGCRCAACGGDPGMLGAKDPTLPGDDAAEETTYEGVLRRLDGLRLDSRRLQERLARSTAIARGIGATEQ